MSDIIRSGFCPDCGTRLKFHEDTGEKYCPNCHPISKAEDKPISSASCSSCGGAMTYDAATNTLVCKYCSNVSLDMRHTYEHITTSHDFEKDLEYLLSNAEELLKTGEYESATECFREISKDFAKDHRGWWGVVRSVTKDFTDTSIADSVYENTVYKNYKNALSKAPDEEKARLEAVFTEYSDLVSRQNERVAAAYRKMVRNERLTALSFPLAVIGYAIFYFAYICVVTLLCDPHITGRTGPTPISDFILILAPILVFGIAYGIWALMQMSEGAFIGMVAVVILSTAEFLLASSMLVETTFDMLTIVIGLIMYAIPAAPGLIMTWIARN